MRHLRVLRDRRRVSLARLTALSLAVESCPEFPRRVAGKNLSGLGTARRSLDSWNEGQTLTRSPQSVRPSISIHFPCIAPQRVRDGPSRRDSSGPADSRARGHLSPARKPFTIHCALHDPTSAALIRSGSFNIHACTDLISSKLNPGEPSTVIDSSHYHPDDLWPKSS